MNKSKLLVVCVIVSFLMQLPQNTMGATIVSVNLSAEELKQAGKNICVYIDAKKVLQLAGIKGKPDINAIKLKTSSGANKVSKDTLCGVFADINPQLPSNSTFYVVWNAPSSTEGGLRAEISLDAVGAQPRPEPQRDPNITGINLVKNGSFEMSPTRDMLSGKKMPKHWYSYRHKIDTIRVTDKAAHSGKYSMQVDNLKSQMIFFGQGWKIPKELAARGAKIYFRTFQKVVKGGESANCMYRVRCFGAKSTFLGDLVRAAPVSKDDNGWELVQGVGKLPVATTNMNFQFYIPGKAPEQTVCFDDFQLQPEPLMLATLSVKPTMISKSEKKAYAYCTISPGKGLFVGKNSILASGKAPGIPTSVLLRQNFTQRQLAGSQIRAVFVSCDSGKASSPQSSTPLQIGKEQTLNLSVENLNTGNYKVRIEVVTPAKKIIEAAETNIKVEPEDPFAGA
jgi:hypothetical protein